jgi:hypothetical protein
MSPGFGTRMTPDTSPPAATRTSTALAPLAPSNMVKGIFFAVALRGLHSAPAPARRGHPPRMLPAPARPRRSSTRAPFRAAPSRATQKIKGPRLPRRVSPRRSLQQLPRSRYRGATRPARPGRCPPSRPCGQQQPQPQQQPQKQHQPPRPCEGGRSASQWRRTQHRFSVSPARCISASDAATASAKDPRWPSSSTSDNFVSTLTALRASPCSNSPMPRAPKLPCATVPIVFSFDARPRPQPRHGCIYEIPPPLPPRKPPSSVGRKAFSGPR